MESKVTKRKFAAIANDPLLNTSPIVRLALNDIVNVDNIAAPELPPSTLVSPPPQPMDIDATAITNNSTKSPIPATPIKGDAVDQPSPVADCPNGTIATTPTLATGALATDTTTPITPSAEAAGAVAATPTAPITPISAIKERKRRIIVDDDDESPTFNPMSRGNKRARRGKGRKGRNNNQRRSLPASPEKSRDAGIFTTPDGKVCTSLIHASHSIHTRTYTTSIRAIWLFVIEFYSCLPTCPHYSVLAVARLLNCKFLSPLVLTLHCHSACRHIAVNTHIFVVDK